MFVCNLTVKLSLRPQVSLDHLRGPECALIL